MRKILGVDPGKSGGLSIIDEQLNLIATYPMPTIKVDGKVRVCPKGIQEILVQYDIELAVIELVGARPGQGGVSMFSFGDSYGVARALTEIHAARVIYARPQGWRGFQSLTGLSKEQVAEVAYNVFQAPGIYGRARKDGTKTIRDGISDSLMIAKYGLRYLDAPC
ncbi:hypothetical protein [Pseudomonas putida]|uniref:hypothetical protein n=1 Tax=Pseudomonas putida TaxID=303 RepID=UPI002022CB21|nr:hypothetical protein [Pseudomonas putida]MCL8307659.1 hypothetical protein [Pseudomonas putida]